MHNKSLAHRPHAPQEAKLALDGGPPAVTEPFPDWPQPSERQQSAVERLLWSGSWWQDGRGPSEELEAWLTTRCGVEAVVTVSSGTVGLELALQAVGVRAGDEVLVPSLTFISSASAVARCGATPVACDVEPGTLNLDVGLAASRLTARTTAVMPVHLAGLPCNMTALQGLAEKHGLLVVEDAAQALGASWRGRPCGSFGDAGVLSFQAAKLLSAGEGGAILGEDQLAERLRLLANCGRPRGSQQYDHAIASTNARMGEFQAAVALAQTPEFDVRRARRSAALEALISNVDRRQWWMQTTAPDVTAHASYMVILQLTDGSGNKVPANWLAGALTAEGVPARAIYPCFHRTPAFEPTHQASGLEGCPNAEAASRASVWIHHRVLLAGDQGVAALSNAMAKVAGHAQHRDSFPAATDLRARGRPPAP